jgi:hypothetical protein
MRLPVVPWMGEDSAFEDVTIPDPLVKVESGLLSSDLKMN